MASADKLKNIMRCPVCFGRDIDVLMCQDENAKHYCIKCGFKGEESEVRAMYLDIKKKFHWISKRITLEEQLNL